MVLLSLLVVSLNLATILLIYLEVSIVGGFAKFCGSFAKFGRR